MHPEPQHFPRLRSSLRVNGSKSKESKVFDFRLLFAPIPHWFPVLEIPDAVVFPAIILERVERLKFVFCDDAVLGHLRYRNESGAGKLRAQHAPEQIIRPEWR